MIKGDFLTPKQRAILKSIEECGAAYFSKDTSSDYMVASRVWLERFAQTEGQP